MPMTVNETPTFDNTEAEQIPTWEATEEIKAAETPTWENTSEFPTKPEAAQMAVNIPQAITGTVNRLFELGAPGSEMAREQRAREANEQAQLRQRQFIAGGGPAAGMSLIPPGPPEAIARYAGTIPGRVLNAITREEQLAGGQGIELPKPRAFGETEEEYQERVKYPLGAPGEPLYIPQTDNPSDMQRWASQASTIDDLASLPIGVTRTGGKILLATMVPGILEQINAIATGPGTAGDKLQKAKDLVIPAAIGVMASRPKGVELLPRRLGPEADIGTPVYPPLEFSGAALPDLPRGATPQGRGAGPAGVGPGYPIVPRAAEPVGPQFPRRGAPIDVPETAAGPRETVLEEIRRNDARTTAQVQKLFPQLSREQAAVYRNAVWGKPNADVGVRVSPAVPRPSPMAPITPRAEAAPPAPRAPTTEEQIAAREAPEVAARRAALEQQIITWERELEFAQKRGDSRAQQQAVDKLLELRRQYEGPQPPAKSPITPKQPVPGVPRSSFPPEVPATAAEPRESVLAEIRRANARTRAEIQRLFPARNLSRQEAAALRDQAWGKQPPGEPPAAPPAAPVPKEPTPPAPAAPAAESAAPPKAEAPAKPAVANLEADAPGKARNVHGDPVGTTYYATPEDWAAWLKLKKLPAKERVLTRSAEYEALRNKYGGADPLPPRRPDPPVPPEQFPPLTPDSRRITIKRADGTTYEAAAGNKEWPKEFTPPGAASSATIHRLSPDGKWSTGFLDAGESIVEHGAKPKGVEAEIAEQNRQAHEEAVKILQEGANLDEATARAVLTAENPRALIEAMAREQGVTLSKEDLDAAVNLVESLKPPDIESTKFAIESSLKPTALPEREPLLTEAQKARLRARVKRAKDEGILGQPEPTPPTPTAEPTPPPKPATFEETPIAGKTIGEWENVKDAGDLPKGAARAELAKWLAVPNQPSRILQALANKKRTREIHGPVKPIEEITQQAPPPAEAPAAEPAPAAPQAESAPAAPTAENPNAARIAQLKQELAAQQKKLDKNVAKMGTMVPPPIVSEITRKISDRMAKIQDEIDRLEALKQPPAPETKPAETETKPPEAATKPAETATKPPKPATPAPPAETPGTPPTAIAAPTAPASETPADQSKPVGTLQPKQQKKFLISEINKALDDAPDQPVEQGKAPRDRESDEEQVERLKENAAILERNKQKFGTVTIEVPGDGIFTVLNVKSALQDLSEKAKKFPVTASREPGKTGTPSGKPTAPSAVGEGSPEDITSALDAFTSQETDPSKPALGYAYSDGKQTVATDGRHMVIIKGALAGGTAKNPKVTSTDGKFVPEGVKPPNYQQVINAVRAESEPWFKGIDTARLFNLLKQAQGAMGDKDLAVQFWRNPDGSLGLKSGGGSVGEYAHNIKEGAKVLAAFNPQYVMDALHAARKMGSEKIDILGKDNLSAALFKGKGVEAIVMPMRLEGPPQTGLTKPKPTEEPPAGEDKMAGPGSPSIRQGPDPVVLDLRTGNPLWNRLQRGYQNFFAGVKQLWTRHPEKLDIMGLSNAAKNLPRIYGQQAGNSLRLGNTEADLKAATMVAQSLKMSGDGISVEDADRLGQLEFEGDPIGYLREKQTDMEVAAQRFLQQGKKLEAAAALEARDAYVNAAANFNRIRPIAERGRAKLDRQFERESASGSDTAYERWYVPQRHELDLFVSANKPIVLGDSKGGGTGAQFKKAKFYEDYASAIEAGWIPRSLNLADLVEHRVAAGERILLNKGFFDSMREIIDPVDQKPVVMDIPQRTIEMPDGTTRRQETIPHGYTKHEISPGVNVAVHDGYSRLVKSLTATSQLAESAVMGTLQNIAAVEKHLMLALDTFHLSRVLQAEFFLTGKMSLGARQRIGRALIEYSREDIGRAVQAGEISQEMADYITTPRPMQVHGRTVNVSPKNLVMFGARQGLNIGRIGDALYRDWLRNVPITGAVNKFVFDKVSRSAIAHGFLAEFERVAKANPDLTGAQVAKRVARDINVLFGNLQQESIFRNPSLRSLTNVLFLAPQWVESLARREARAVLQVGEAVKDIPAALREGRLPRLGSVGKTLGTALAGYFAGTQILNLITRGKFTFQNPEQGHKLDAWIPGGQNGFFISPLSVFGEITHDILRYAETKPDFATAVQQLGMNKLGPLGRFLYVLGTGRDPMTAEKIVGTGRRAVSAALTAAPVPITVSQPLRAVGSMVAPGVISPPAPGAVQRQAMASAGFKTEPVGTAQTQVYRLADQWKAGSDNAKYKAEVERRLKEDFGPSDYRDLRSALSRDDMKAARRAYQELRAEGKTPKTIRQTLQHPHPFTGSQAAENKFKRSLDDEQRDLYDRALEERRELYRKLQQMLSETEPE